MKTLSWLVVTMLLIGAGGFLLVASAGGRAVGPSAPVDAAVYSGPTVVSSDSTTACVATLHPNPTLTMNVTAGDLIYVVTSGDTNPYAVTLSDTFGDVWSSLNVVKPTSTIGMTDFLATAKATGIVTVNITEATEVNAIGLAIHGSTGSANASSYAAFANSGLGTTGGRFSLATANSVAANTLVVQSASVFAQPITFTATTGALYNATAACSTDISLDGTSNQNATVGIATSVISFSSSANPYYGFVEAFLKASGPVPAAPHGLSATAVGKTNATVNWINPVEGIGFALTDNHVAAYTSDCLTPITSHDVGSVATTFDLTSLLTGHAYCARVTATNTNGTSNESVGTVFTTLNPNPATPTGLTARALSTSVINLTWAETNATILNYTVRMGTVLGVWTDVFSTNFALPYEDVGSLTANTTYYFEVEAWSNGGNSSWSSEAHNTTLLAASGGGGAAALPTMTVILGALILLVVLAGVVAIIRAGRYS